MKEISPTTDQMVDLTTGSVEISTTQIYDEFNMFDNAVVDFLDYLYGSGDEELTGKDLITVTKQNFRHNRSTWESLVGKLRKSE